MRRVVLGLAVLAGLTAGTSTARAQNTNFSDPFFLYYGFYLPRQQALINQPGPETTIQAAQMNRQQMTVYDRAGMYSPQPGIGAAELNSDAPFAGRTMSRSPRARTTPTGVLSTNIHGLGHSSYFSRTGVYYPTIRSGRGRSGSGRPAGGGAMMPGMGGGGMAGMGGVPSPMSGAPAMNVQNYGR
jgi:hypothetical protein